MALDRHNSFDCCCAGLGQRDWRPLSRGCHRRSHRRWPMDSLANLPQIRLALLREPAMKYELTELKVKRLKKPGRHGDGNGLYLAISNTGARSWIFMWKKGGKRYAMGLGSLAKLPLKEARDLAMAAHKDLREGKNPKAARNAREAGTLTFGDAADKFIAAKASGWKAKHKYQWVSSMSDKYIASLRPLAVSAISTDDVLKILTPIWQKKHITAARIRNRIEVVLDWAKAMKHRDGDNPARWRGHMQMLLARPTHAVKGLAAMPYAEVPDFTALLRKQDRVAARALEFLILTAARTAEVCGARWDEIDLDNAVWVIPDKRMKSKRLHRVPLSGRAMAILKNAKAHHLPSPYVFPSSPDRALYRDPMMAALRELRDTVTVHGFRSSFR
ncbi:MAG: integrase arm-type DNA-binding domain-containing protein, partial [Xanthobacteraceae bacterium]